MKNDLLEVSVSSLNEEPDIITDESEVLPAFCQSLEAVLRQGLKLGLGALGLADRDYWNCIEGLVSSSKVIFKPPPSVSHVISLVQGCKRLTTAQSRGRLFIRIALTKGVLLQTLETLLKNQEYLRYWYKDLSLLANHQEKEVVMEIMNTLKKKTYKLNVNNCSFLSETWLIPEIQQYELAPISVLGLTLFSDEGKCIIVDVKSASVAEEKGMVPGDCLDDLYGQVIDEKWARKIGVIKKRNNGKPVTLTIIKGRYKNGKWFSPLFQRYSNLCSTGKCTGMELSKPNTNQTNGVKSEDVRSSFDVTYYGAQNVGKNGSCIYVPDAIKKLIVSEGVLNKKLKFQLMERDILLTCQETGEVFARHSYTETSSCSIGENDATFFGFITGNTTCSFADQFECHVFSSISSAVSKQIVEGIGKGFDRTVYCV